MPPHAKFPVEVLTPDGWVFNGEAEMVSTRTTLGQIGILARHAPLLATLEPTELRIYQTETDIIRLAQSEGYLQVGDNRALILVGETHPIADLDPDDLSERLRQAELDLEAAGEDSEKRQVAERDRRRWEKFLSLAQ
jgi:F-type H+-transporting ATPase subunit epsilon